MKKFLSIILMALTMHVFGQISETNDDVAGYYSSSSFSSVETEETINVIGTVMLKGDNWVIHGTAGNSGDVRDYYPSNLTRQFKENGIRVTVKATLDPIPDGVRLAGTPITIVTIQKL